MTGLTPLDHTSLTWRYFGQWAGFAGGSVPQLLQLMHPVLGHAVAEHSNVREDPFDRLIRSMGPIYGVIYDGPQAPATAEAVRGYHEFIKGTMPSGERYSGLNPEVFHWAHATFAHGLIYGFSTLLGPFTRAQQQQLYEETKQWYELYGMSLREVPETLADFDAYWDHYVNDVLEVTESAEWLLDTFRNPPPPPGLEWVPETLWRPIGKVVGSGAVALAAGLLPPVIRDRLGLPWNRLRWLQYQAVRWSVWAVVMLTPRQYRFHPRARAGWKREARAAGVSVRELISRPAASGSQIRL